MELLSLYFLLDVNKFLYIMNLKVDDCRESGLTIECAMYYIGSGGCV